MMSTVSIIGSGKAAHFMSAWLLNSGHQIQHIYARDPHVGNALAAQSGARFHPISDIKDSKSDFMILAVSDSAIKELSSEAPPTTILIHLSGASSIDLLQRNQRGGVLWPIISLNNNARPSRNIPLLYESTDFQSLEKLRDLAASLSDLHIESAWQKRTQLHLSAVFAGNFSNFLYHVAWKLCQTSGQDFRLLLPLIRQNSDLLDKNDPFYIQTGPALRNDEKVIEQHCRLLGELELFDELGIYKELTKLIIKRSKEEK